MTPVPHAVSIVFNAAGDSAGVEVTSVGDAVTDVARTLTSLGARVTCIPVGASVRSLIEALEAAKPDVVFNLCEAYRDWSGGEACVAGLLELLDLPYTGSGPVALGLALDKPLAKQLFRALGVATPRAVVYRDVPASAPALTFPLILKLATEDASLGISPDNVVFDESACLTRLGMLLAEYRTPVLVEEFVDGREFTVAILGGEPLVVEEIEFRVAPKIVSFAAKWDAASAEYRGTVPLFTPAIADPQRAAMLSSAARVCEAFGIRDHARVDFRMDCAGELYVLEVNPNPDITPGSGYRKALDAAGIPFQDFVVRLIDAAMARHAVVCS